MPGAPPGGKPGLSSYGSSASLMSSSFTSPATSTTASGRTSPWALPCGDAGGSRPKPLLIMNIDIGDGRTGRLEVHKGDDCHQLATQFCKGHELPLNLVAKQLAEQIAKSMAAKGIVTCPVQAPQSVPPAGSSDGDSSSVEDGVAGQVEREEAPKDTVGLGRHTAASAHINVCSATHVEGHKATAFNRFAALETREFSRGTRRTEPETSRREPRAPGNGHARLYEQGMNMIQDRKRRSEEHERSVRSSSAGKLRPVSDGAVPGRFTHARARSAPRQRARELSAGQTDAQATMTERVSKSAQARTSVTPQRASARKGSSRPPFRGGASRYGRSCELEASRASELRSKSAPRERPTGHAGDTLPAHERLFNLAHRGKNVEEHDNAKSPACAPWFAGGTHWQRAERQRMRGSSSVLSFRSERSHLNRSSEASTEDEPIYERLYKESFVKSSQQQEKAAAREREQEEHDRLATRRRQHISARSEELLAEKGRDDHDTEVFERLYEQGVERVQERQRLHAERLKNLEREALLARQSKFIPGQKVKPFEPDLPKSARAIKRGEAWVDRIDTLVEQKRQQEEANQIAAELKELSQCTFRPEISKFASQHKRDLKGNVSIHDALFEEAKESREKSPSFQTCLIATKKVSKEEEKVGPLEEQTSTLIAPFICLWVPDRF